MLKIVGCLFFNAILTNRGLYFIISMTKYSRKDTL